MAVPTALLEARRFLRRARLCASIAAISAVAAVTAVAAPDSPPDTALADYVAAPDASFSWRVHARFDAPGAEIVELRLVSQTWRGIEWKHRLHLVKPDTSGTGTA